MRAAMASRSVVVLLIALVGCKPGTPASNTTPSKVHDHPTEGPNAKGPLAGFDAEGRDLGHAEITLNEEGTEVVVYFVDEKAAKKMNLAADKITGAKIKLEKPLETKWIALTHDATRSGEKGHAFVGKLPMKVEIKSNKDLVGEITVTLDGRTLADEEFPEKH